MKELSMRTARCPRLEAPPTSPQRPCVHPAAMLLVGRRPIQQQLGKTWRVTEESWRVTEDEQAVVIRARLPHANRDPCLDLVYPLPHAELPRSMVEMEQLNLLCISIVNYHLIILDKVTY